MSAMRTAAVAAVAATAGAAAMHIQHVLARRQRRERRSGSPGTVSSTQAVQAGESVTVDGAELRRFVAACLEKAGAEASHAALVADVLVAADERGIPSHGVNRCDIYCAELQAGHVDGSATPTVMAGCDGPSTAVIDGRNALGAVVSRFAMKQCIQKAKDSGLAMVVCCHSNHFGIAAYWAHMAMREGLIGFSFTNTSPFMVPTRATARAAGTNPICCCCPAGPGESFELDMATTAVPIGKVEVLHRKGVAVPLGWGVDGKGQCSSTASEILRHGGLCPLGGDEGSAGYKGFGLSMLVEVLCAILSGTSCAGPSVPRWLAKREGALDYGHCFLVVDPARFAPGFEERLAGYLASLRALPRADDSLPVLVPGDPEKACCTESSQRGVRLNANVAASLCHLAEQLTVQLPPALQPLRSATDGPCSSSILVTG